MSTEDDVFKAKENLQNALGERFAEYSFFFFICFVKYIYKWHTILFLLKLYAKHEKMVQRKSKLFNPIFSMISLVQNSIPSFVFKITKQDFDTEARQIVTEKYG